MQYTYTTDLVKRLVFRAAYTLSLPVLSDYCT